MTRKMVKFGFIENNTERKISYNRRQKGFMKKAHELSTLGDVEIATVIYSPYNNEPVVFPHYEDALNTFRKFRKLPTLVQSKSIVTREEFTKVKEITNPKHEVLKGKGLHIDREGSTSNASQLVVRSMVSGWTSSEWPTTPLLSPAGGPISVVPLVAPSTVPGGTNFEVARDPLLVPDVAPTWVVSMVPQQLFYLAAPLRTPPQMVPPMDPSRVPPRRAPVMAPLLPSTTMVSEVSTPVFPLVIPQMDSSMNIPPIDLSMLMNDYQKYSIDDFPQSPALTERIDWDYDEMNFFDDSYFNKINAKGPNHNNTDGEWSPALSESIDWSNDNVMALFDDSYWNKINVQDPNHNNNF